MQAALCSALGYLRLAASLTNLPAGATRAAAASWNSGRLLACAAGGGDGAAAAPPPLPPGTAADDVGAGPAEPADDHRAASLPVEQLSKALLAGNARAQLTTVTAGEPGQDASKVTSTVAHYLSPRGEAPVVLLSREDSGHLNNLRESTKASLATGHISPPWFIQRLRATGWLPRRVALLGNLQRLPAAEVKFAVEQARKACRGAPSLAQLLPTEEQLPGLLGYRLEGISQCVYVDAMGKQHAVGAEDLDSSFVDPLALSQQDLLADLNLQPGWQQQLQFFCGAYLGVSAHDVLLTEADRLGFTMLSAPTPEAAAAGAGGGDGQQRPQQPRWRQFRIGFNREMRSRQHFMELLEQMKAEVAAAAQQ